MDIRLPQEFLQKLQLESPDLPKPLSRMSRRASLVSPKRVRTRAEHPVPNVDGYTLVLVRPAAVSRDVPKPLAPPAGHSRFIQADVFGQHSLPRWVPLGLMPPLGPRVSTTVSSIDQLMHASCPGCLSDFLGSIFQNTDSGSHSRYPQNQTLGGGAQESVLLRVGYH